MVKKLTLIACVFGAFALSAAPAAKGDPVAEGYPDWQGAVDKNYICGRNLCASDLRHKITIVVDLEPNAALQNQFVLAYNLVQLSGLYGIGSEWDWEAKPILPRDVIVVVSNRGGGKDKDVEEIKASLKYKGDDESIARAVASMKGIESSIYHDITFPGAPDTTGKRPYVYVMGIEGTTPIYQGALDDKGVGEAKKAVRAELAKLRKAEFKWMPFYGSIPEPQFNPQFAKTIAKGKPLKPLATALLKDVVSKDADRAKEAQILFDALNQTRSDMVFRIQAQSRGAPHRALCELQQLVKFWPSEKKRLDVVVAKAKTIPGANKLAVMLGKIMGWEDPNFMCKNAGEAKKIVLELKKMKKDLEKMKESDVIVVQNGALLLDTHVDTLIELIPTRVPEK